MRDRIIEHLTNVYKLCTKPTTILEIAYFYVCADSSDNFIIISLKRDFSNHANIHYYRLGLMYSVHQELILDESDEIENEIDKYFKSLNIFIDIRRNNTIDKILK